MQSTAPGIFTIPPGTPFLHALARALLAGDLPRPGGTPPSDLALPGYTIYLPTRRAARALQDAFLEVVDGRALLLPRIKPISEGNEDLSLLTSFARPDALTAADIPPAIGEIERRLVLTSLVQRWSQTIRTRGEADDGLGDDAIITAAGAQTTAQAAALAAELAGLMDEVETEELSLAPLAGLVPEHYSEHWQKTLDFLQIVLHWWPDYLDQSHLISPMDRRNRLIRAEALQLVRQPPPGPVIVAGVTGSVPATAELMGAVLSLERGAIVLPGLDIALQADDWSAIAPEHPEHPQFGFARLLETFRRSEIHAPAIPAILPGVRIDACIETRNAFVAEAMRPASTTERWRHYVERTDRTALAAALQDITLIEAATAEDEAEAVALIMRQVAETPGRTAALVSRDRLLARRVAVRLQAWGIRIDDSAGRPLAKTMPGAFLDLLVEAVASGFAPADTMALLKHPLTRLQLPAAAIRRAARALEIAVFRTLYLGRGIDGIAAALDRAEHEANTGERRERAVRRLWDDDWKAAHDLVARLRDAVAPLATLLAGQAPVELRDLARAHIQAAETVAALPEGDPARGLWAEEAGETASLFMMGLIEDSLPQLLLPPAEYPDVYRGLVQRETVRPRVPLHPRLSIWGPLEARLQQPDVVIVGSLNEGVWPEQVDTGPWLNRPMRAELGLPQPEERIGYAAHDVSMLLGAPTVYLTRAMKSGGAPTVPSRWLLRLRALLDALGMSDALASSAPWLQWALWRNVQHAPPERARPPEPRPPLSMRPRKLSVSAVETWIANPYALFARTILKLEPLPMLGEEPGAALRGAIIHEALSAFAREFPDELPDATAQQLVRIAMHGLSRLGDNPRIAAFWKPRLERFAEWFADTEQERRAGVLATLTEVAGEQVLQCPVGPFTLTARADRIDVTAAGIVITDYKTGANLSGLKSRAATGEAPQLALEAAIALAGGFANVPSARIAGLRYISVSGGEPPGDNVPLKADDFAGLAAGTIAGLQNLIEHFDNPDTGYRAMRRARFSYDFDDYAHLARVDEWSGGDGGGDGGLEG